MHALFPLDQALSFTSRILGSALLLGLLLVAVGAIRKRRPVVYEGVGIAALAVLTWGTLYLARPSWLRLAMRPDAVPTADAPQWSARAPGFETAELEVRSDGSVVDMLALTRIDPKVYQLSVHWDPTASRTAEDWQRELNAAVVINGSYFLPDGAPQTPLRIQGARKGPAHYSSSHGALVIDGGADIIDLRGQDVASAIEKYPEAMVSYPLLVDPNGDVRAGGSSEWLASRSFVAVDSQHRVLLGTTQTGYFSLRRLAAFLKAAPLDIRAALNLDGGPVASQVVSVAGYVRATHGSAEISDASDVLRAFWQARRTTHWRLPIVLTAAERAPAGAGP